MEALTEVFESHVPFILVLETWRQKGIELEGERTKWQEETRDQCVQIANSWRENLCPHWAEKFVK